jgi:ribose-phosphate pyrophosphokinase
VVTNTIPLSEEGIKCNKINVLSVAELLGETIKRIYNSDSVSTLFV